MSSFHVEHKLGREQARQRIETLAVKHGITADSKDGGYSGVAEKSLPFVGAVSAEFKVLEDRIELQLVRAPSFPSADTLRRLITEELSRALAN